MQPFLKGMLVTTAAFAVIGGFAAAYLLGRNSSTQDDVRRALNSPTPAATYTLPAPQAATKSPTITTPVSSPKPPAAPASATKPAVPKKPAQYKNVDAGYLASKIGWERILDNGSKLSLSGLSDFRGVAGDFNGDGLEDLAYISTKVRPEYANSLDITSVLLENTGVGYKVIPPTTEGISMDGSNNPQAFLSDIKAADLNSDGIYEIITSVLAYNSIPYWSHREVYIHSFDERKMKVQHVLLRFNEEPIFWDADVDGIDELFAINRLGSPIRGYRFGVDGWYVATSTGFETAMLETVKKMAGTLANTSFSAGEKEERIAITIRNDPYVGAIAVSIIGGYDLDVYMQQHKQDLGLELTMMYSSLVRGSFESAGASFASGDFAGGLAKGLMGVAIGEAAKSSIGNFLSQNPSQIYRTPDGSLWERSSDGRWKFLETSKR